MPGTAYYATPGSLTVLDSVDGDLLQADGSEPKDVCWPVHSLVIQPIEAEQLGFTATRLAENQVRPADRIVRALLALEGGPLSVPREPPHRVVGTCRHFAVLACALLRHNAVPARVRCGFATYFQSGLALDHWITEYWDETQTRWVRIDPEILGQTVLDHPEDLRPGEFLSGGEAWRAYRRGEVDPHTFGVCGTTNFGAAEISGNAVRDLAALNKVEMLPWDEWGRMDDAYKKRTGSEYEALIDTLTDVCHRDEPAAIADLYTHEDLIVPASMIV
ncbi:MAG: transglutaminase-like domain-containing protein [Mycobacteriales bacterium]